MTIELNKALFEKNVNTKFLLCDANGEHALDLIELKSGNISPMYESFSLLFRGDGGTVHEQRTYLMKHATVGEFDLFLTPVGRSEQGTFYEAVFNQLVERLNQEKRDG